MDFKSEHEMIEFLIKDGFLKTFRTKKEAQVIAKKFGWANFVFKHVRRFETVWIIGQKDNLFSWEKFGVAYIPYKFPALRFDGDEQPVFKANVLISEVSKK